MDKGVISELTRMARKARVFVSMPWVEGLTPEFLGKDGNYEIAQGAEEPQRRHGIYRMTEAALSPLDHGGLYGDACFEGILIKNGHAFLYLEHLERWFRSAGKMSIQMPYSIEDIGWQILRTIQAVGFADDETGYLRPVLTRGFGNLGINPAKCLAPTVYCIVSTIQLYPPEAYDRGIELSVAREIRRPGRETVDPNIKSNNYLNNIFGLLETRERKTLETMMLTAKGFVAEATADNVFLIRKEDGWETNPERVHLFTPVTDYCLKGITRDRILINSARKGFQVHEVSDLLPLDFVGAGKEVFMTGTGCGLMPVVAVEGQPVGNGTPGPVTRQLLDAIRADMANPKLGVSIHADKTEYGRYMSLRCSG
jgi:branched-chain amino acid aminotransferase